MGFDLVFGIRQVACTVASGCGRLVGKVTQRPQFLQRVCRDLGPGGRRCSGGVLPHKMVETRLEGIGLGAPFGVKIRCLARILRRVVELGARRVDIEIPCAD